MVLSFGLMDQNIKENLISTKFKATDIISGLMVDNTKVSGKITKCTAEESSPGSMAEDIKVNITWTKSKAEEYSLGQTVDRTKDSGEMENNRAKESIEIRTEMHVKEYGKMVKK